LVEKENVKNTRIFVDRKFSDEGVRLISCTNCTIVGCDFSFNADDKPMLDLKDCVNCVITRCKFHDKTTKGQLIKIQGEKSKGNVIENCKFFNTTFDEENGGECIQIGLSPFSGCSFDTVVKNCFFTNLKADPETISIKSCGNVIENNLFANNYSNVTFRHGGHNKVLNNVFIGSGGIRLYGSHNEVIGNYHFGNDDRKDDEEKHKKAKRFLPLLVGSGTLEDDPNFKSEGTAIGKKGCKHHVYAQTKNNKIENNIYHNCKGICVNWGNKKQPLDLDEKDDEEKVCKENNGKKFKMKGPPVSDNLPAINNTFKNNILIADNANLSSIMFVFAKHVKAEDRGNTNTFLGNKRFNGKFGKELQQKGEDILRSKPGISFPSVGAWERPDAKVV
jgi:hypothetical protein